jgi:hypothetical protein
MNPSTQSNAAVPLASGQRAKQYGHSHAGSDEIDIGPLDFCIPHKIRHKSGMDENIFDVSGRVFVESLQVKLMQEAEIDSSRPLDPQVLRDLFIGVHAISLVSSKRNMRHR